jgi:hypothetical protein
MVARRAPYTGTRKLHGAVAHAGEDEVVGETEGLHGSSFDIMKLAFC